MPDLKLPILRSVSPSLAELLRSCKLRAGLSYAEGTQAFTIGNPKAWLGDAYHRIMARAPQMLSAENADDLDQRFEQEWAESIRDIAAVAINNDANARFGQPYTWPGYFVVRAIARQRVKSLAAERRYRTGHSAPAPQRGAREHRYDAVHGKLVGRIDLVDSDEVVDFKSGDVFEDSGSAEPSIRAAYVRQLQLYGYLVAENTGIWPRRGRLIPPYGPSVAIDLDEEACTREAADAIRLLDEYNQAVTNAAGAEALAEPNPEHCRWCQYKLICPAFWQSIDASWCARLESEALEGELLTDPVPLRNGQAVALDIGARKSTFAASRRTVAPLDATWHSRISTARVGDVVRLSGLGRRQDGGIYPSKWTNSIRDDDVPSISLPGDD